MITVEFGQINKRPNSTKNRFSNGVGITFDDVTFKSNVDLKSPIFLINTTYAAIASCNYARWDNLYYYIDNLVYVANNRYEVHCSLDLLATYKNQIVGAKAALLYTTDTSYVDYWKDDLRFIPTTIRNDCNGFNHIIDQEHRFENYDNNPKCNIYDLAVNNTHFDFTNGVFIMNCIGNGNLSGAGAGPHNWVLTKAEMQYAIQNIMSFDILHSTTAQISAVKSLVWLPISRTYILNHAPVHQATLEINGENLGDNRYYIDSVYQMLEGTFDIDVPIDDYAAQKPEWMENGRWKTLELQLPGGVINIDPDIFYGIATQKVLVYYAMDLCTGDTNFRVYPKLQPPGAGGSNHNIGNKLLGQTSICYGLDVINILQRNRILNDDLRNIIFTGAKAGLIATSAIAGGPLLGSATATVSNASGALSKLESAGITSGGAYEAAKANLAAANQKMNSAKTISSLGKATAFAASNVESIGYSPSINCFSMDSSGSPVFSCTTFGTKFILSAKYYINDMLYYETIDSSPRSKWNTFCHECGYPANAGIYALREYNYYVCQYVAIKTGNSSMTAEEAIAIEEVCKHGIWLE